MRLGFLRLSRLRLFLPSLEREAGKIGFPLPSWREAKSEQRSRNFPHRNAVSSRAWGREEFPYISQIAKRTS